MFSIAPTLISFQNLYIEGLPLVLFLCVLVLLLLFYVAYTRKGRLGFWMRKRYGLRRLGRTTEDYKKSVAILFIDDQGTSVAASLRDDNWHVKQVRDAAIDSECVKNADIIFVDWKNVGSRISIEMEGIALSNLIKSTYKHRKYVVLYSAKEYAKPEGSKTDYFLSKGSDVSVYVRTIENACFILFG